MQGVKPFRERNPLIIGAVGLTVIALLMLAAFFADDLPIIGGGTTYSADFSEAAGLVPGNEVRVAGVKVGKVRSVSLDGDHVRIDFRVDDAWVGDQTTAAIKIKTLLGQKYLALDPLGAKALDPGTAIPRNHTLSPYDVNEAFNGLATTVDQVDTNQLAQSFEVLSQTFANTPQDVKTALNGLSALSKTISSRDQQLAQLLSNTNQITKTISDRDKEFQTLLSDGNLLLQELRNRESAITQLLTGTKALSAQLSGLVNDNQAQLQPALQQLEKVTTVLERNQANLSKGIADLAPFYRVFANTLGSGRWFDTYICGLLPPSIGPINPEGCSP
ncbi:ABC transporter substrate-binding protein [Kutzneria sp. 744]|nr:ABC transporter substrate-binding protein [Kutzneria sp. 744]